ncbi:hypothetical protein [Streptomyces sp. LN704]|uniref:hypothetical protein n=1 Tax=Streptomyces sp. LN704 TaxID=3112982 RepID=UPI003711DDF8
MSPTARGSPTRHSAHRTNTTATATAPSIPRDLVVDVPDVGTHSAGPPDGRARTALAAKQREKTQDAAGLKGPRSAADVRAGLHNAGAPDGSARTTLVRPRDRKGVLGSTQLGNAAARQRRTTREYAPDQADQAREPAGIVGLAAPALKPGRSAGDPRGLPVNAPPSVGTSGVGAQRSPLRRRHRPGVPRPGANEVRRVR